MSLNYHEGLEDQKKAGKSYLQVKLLFPNRSLQIDMIQIRVVVRQQIILFSGFP